jgi:hypothetical protein
MEAPIHPFMPIRHHATPSWFEAREGLAPHHEGYW